MDPIKVHVDDADGGRMAQDVNRSAYDVISVRANFHREIGRDAVGVGHGLSGEIRVSARHFKNPRVQVTTPGGTASAFATGVGIVRDDIGTVGAAETAGALQPKGLAALTGAAVAHGAAALGAAWGAGVEQHPVKPSAATRARAYFMAEDSTHAGPPANT
jgi:hypothetical protein